ncbi:MAG: S8 family serine peptidase, partial [Bacteroidota bacterium]
AQSYHGGNADRLWPLEIQQACLEVIRLATALGIIVIEACGNGNTLRGQGINLDLFELNGKTIFNIESDGFKDSGAIIVAAATLNTLHERVRYSNYGSRINCYAWGEGVAAFEHIQADGKLKTCMRKLNGTSSAAAIIAGATLAVQSVLEAGYNIRLSPKQMRYVLSNDLYGTASAAGRAKDKIGVMPDLKRIIDNFLRVIIEEKENEYPV